MKIIPVLDLMGGVVVRGVAGRREEYRPVVSRLTASPEPLAVARAVRDAFGLSLFYLADLDAIRGGAPASGVYQALHDDGFALWVDAGVRRAEDAAGVGSAGLIAGLETLAGPGELAKLLDALGPGRVAFSLDLQAGVPLGPPGAWPCADAAGIAGHAVGLGARRLIVLDLASVGVGRGTRTDGLCLELSRAHPGVELITGGGVRGPADLRRLEGCGVAAVLVASALHDGGLTPGDLRP